MSSAFNPSYWFCGLKLELQVYPALILSGSLQPIRFIFPHRPSRFKNGSFPVDLSQ